MIEAGMGHPNLDPALLDPHMFEGEVSLGAVRSGGNACRL